MMSVNEPDLKNDMQQDEVNDENSDIKTLIDDVDSIINESESGASGASASGQTDSGDPDIETADMLMGFVSPAFDLVAPNWNVSMNEKQALCGAYGALIDKYFPDGNYSKWAAEIAAVGITITVFSSRKGTPRRLEDKSKQGKDKKQDVETEGDVEEKREHQTNVEEFPA